MRVYITSQLKEEEKKRYLAFLMIKYDILLFVRLVNRLKNRTTTLHTYKQAKDEKQKWEQFCFSETKYDQYLTDREE